MDLQGSNWRAILIRAAPPVIGAEPTIRFDGDQAGGTTGCNAYGGSFQLDADGTFRMDSMIMTEMACDEPRGNQEAVVIDILSHADRLELVGGELRISGPSGSITFAEDPR
jgi:heat shock protein HslJ